MNFAGLCQECGGEIHRTKEGAFVHSCPTAPVPVARTNPAPTEPDEDDPMLPSWRGSDWYAQPGTLTDIVRGAEKAMRHGGTQVVHRHPQRVKWEGAVIEIRGLAHEVCGISGCFQAGKEPDGE